MFTEMGIKIKALIARKGARRRQRDLDGAEGAQAQAREAAEAEAAAKAAQEGEAMSDPCEFCLNNLQDEYGSYYCAQGGALDEDEMARYLSRSTACPFFEPGDEYKIVANKTDRRCFCVFSTTTVCGFSLYQMLAFFSSIPVWAGAWRSSMPPPPPASW